ncbi:cytochrome b/b6 domain-containing protein [Benzoatithermus flavus]|uniref:Cytochrome b/b6 domain-containing protein n=1 Tax=Benzoatithermus flavus TaxID=3108223 RepID=A0ABU8XXM3_9PROT
MRAPAGPAAAEVRVWDPLVRLFHWSLVAAFFTAFLAEEGETLHDMAGYVVLGLIGFRLVWGFVGPKHARFADFVPTPQRLVAYLAGLVRGRPERYLGHNPAGGVMILLLLAAVLVTAGSGWLMTTDRFWGVDWVEELHEVAAYATLALIGVHIAGVVVSSLLHRENLVRAMITGRKPALAG